MSTAVRPFECDLKDWDGESVASTIYATTRGKARYQKYLAFRDAGWDVRFQDITVRPCGPAPVFLEAFARTAKSRGVPFAYPGMRVEVAGHAGTIVGKNSSSNFNVYFEAGPHKGLTLNCHPNWKMRYFSKDGKLLHDSEVKEAVAC